MKKTQRKAFILNECKSPYIQQAIFILRDGFDTETSGIVADAERIVASYLGNTISPEKKKNTKSLLPSILLAGISLAIIAFSIYFIIK